ncbi:MinD/ParA family ATP-binding protein [Nocardia alni]|uniref:MinD/ParA family ATP-binding protein n=1 Tax=Nocardia alni TaxID=2815723 RepID=UPI0027DEBC4F|nr:MinD/ParA family protein [Nocardia alni]
MSELPMLPPWLSESEDTQSGYEAPVENLPQQDLIPEKSRRRFGRKSEPDTGTSLKNSRKPKRKGKSEDAHEQQPWGETQYEDAQPAQSWDEPQQQNFTPQPWGAPLDGSMPPDGEMFSDGGAAQPDPQQSMPNRPYPNGQQHQQGEMPPSGGGFAPGPDMSSRQPGPLPQVPPPGLPPIPEAPQGYSDPLEQQGDPTEMTVRVEGRPDLPPPPEQTPPGRPPLPEPPPGPGERQPDPDQFAAAAPPSPPEAEQGAPTWLGGPEAEAQGGQEQPGPDANFPPPAIPPQPAAEAGGRNQAFDTPAPTHPGPDDDRTTVWQGDPNAQAPRPPQQPPNGMGPGASGFTGQQPVAPQQYPPQGFGPDPRMTPPGPPPAQNPQWQQGGQGRPPQFQQPGYGQPQQFQQPPGQFRGPQGGPPPSLDNVPVRRAKKTPGTGWRRTVHHISGGAINPGMSAEERRLQELVARIRQPVQGDYRIAVLSLKGGVGKTTTTMGIGSIFASIRGDRVIAVDANPDFGTLSQRVQLQTRSTVRDLLLDPAIRSYGDVRRHTSQGTSRLEVLASERDPAASESFSDEEYRRVARILQRFYNIILTDCGTGLMHSAMTGVLELAHSLVLISSSAIDGARSAAATLDWLSLHGHDHLVRNAVVVINLPRPGSPNVGIQQLREYFLSRCRAVHIIPYDPHLSEGAEIELARLHKNTKRALVELSATVADDFAVDHSRFQY